jgi:hypothetical protein
VNSFNPAFSWYEILFGPADFQKTLAAFPIVLQGSGGNAPFITIGGLDNTWVQGRRASRFFINDNLAWTFGPHEFRFGIRPPACNRSRSPLSPMAGYMHPISWNGASPRSQIGSTVDLRAQYAGTRAVNQPYTSQVNGYQTVCPGCFRALSRWRSRRSALWRRHPIEHRTQ